MTACWGSGKTNQEKFRKEELSDKARSQKQQEAGGCRTNLSAREKEEDRGGTGRDGGCVAAPVPVIAHAATWEIRWSF